MRDVEIRHELLADLRYRYPRDRIRNELGLCLGQTRVDVAVINGRLHGYEIKSERDTLNRLEAQVHLYGKVLDHAWVVTGARHFDHIVDIVPGWWGILRAEEDVAGDICLVEERESGLNPDPDPFSIAQMLWRDEAANVLIGRGEKVLRRETRWEIWDRLTMLDLPDLQLAVRTALKARPDWPGG